MRRLLLALALALALTGTGCAYYNTFYLARKYYRQALDEELKNTTGKPSPQAGQLYEKSIKQSSKVLQRYSDSKWADDAMLLMGQSYFGQGQYLSARRWFGELETRHPDSPLRPQAQLWTGRSLLMEEDFEEAARLLRQAIDTWPSFEGRDDALFFLAETDLQEERFAEAIVGYSSLLKSYPKSPRVPEALLRVGDAQFGLRQYAEAEKSYNQAAARSREPRQRVQALLRVGAALEKEERFEDALDLYDVLGRELIPGDHRNTILLGFDAVTNLPPPTTSINSNLQQEQQIIDSLREIDAQGNEVIRNPAAASIEAQRVAQLSDEERDRLADETSGLAPLSGRPIDGNATARQAAATATAANPLAIDMPLVLLRQANALLEMGRSEDAIKTFEAVMAAYPRTSESAEAQYRIGYIQEVYLEDYAAARVSYDAVRQHGQNLFGEQATRRASGLARLVQLAAADTLQGGATDVDKEAEKQFLAAELAYFQQDRADKALEAYSLVETNYPGTSFAARSGLARAWLLYHVVEDSAGGRQAFADVAERYAGTEQARIAHQILYGEVVDDPSARPDSLAIAAFEDSLRMAEAQAESLALGVSPVDSLNAGFRPGPGDSAAMALGLTPGVAATPVVTETGAAPDSTDPAVPPVVDPGVDPNDQAAATLAEARRDSLADVRDAARRASEAEARAMAEAARAGGAAARVDTATFAGIDTAGASPRATPGVTTTPPAAATPPGPVGTSTEASAITASRLVPEGAAGLPRPLSKNANVRAPVRTPPPSNRRPVRRPAAADSTRPGGTGAQGRSPGDAHP